MAARELAREGHRPAVFEQGSRPGGVWVYTDAVEEAQMPGEVHCFLLKHCATFLAPSRGQLQIRSTCRAPISATWSRCSAKLQCPVLGIALPLELLELKL